MDAGEFYEFMERLSRLADHLAPAIEEQKAINATLLAMLARQDERLTYAEETLRRLTALEERLNNPLGNGQNT